MTSHSKKVVERIFSAVGGRFPYNDGETGLDMVVVSCSGCRVIYSEVEATAILRLTTHIELLCIKCDPEAEKTAPTLSEWVFSREGGGL